MLDVRGTRRINPTVRNREGKEEDGDRPVLNPEEQKKKIISSTP